MSVTSHHNVRSLSSITASKSPRRCVFIACMLLVTCLAPLAKVRADDKAKEIARGLLRGLIESQLERQERESFGPGRPVPPVHVPIPQPQRATPEMLQLRQILASMSLESDTLLTSLVNDSRRSFEVRALQPSAMQYQAAVAAVQQRANRENGHLVLQLSGQTISQTWKTLAHDIGRSRGVSQPSKESLERLNALDGKMCELLGIRESFNSRELVRAADLLAADLKSLSDEISFVNAPAGVRPGLPNRIRRLQDQASLFANLAASGARPQNVVAEYQTLYQSWQAIRPELDLYNTRSIANPVSRIQQTHRLIHQLLRLEFGPDFALIQRMAVNLDAEVSQLFRAITLEHIMLIPDSRSLPSQADALAGTCQNLTDVVSRRESLQAIGEAWAYLNEQWSLVEFYVQPINSPDVRRRVEGISQSIASLKNAIGVNVSFDPAVIRQQCAELASLADHLNTTVRRWTARTGQQNVALTQKTTQLLTLCDEMSALSMGRRNVAVVRDKCDAVIVLWQELRPMLDTCQTAERDAIEQAIDRFIPTLVQLRTMVEE